MGRVRRLLASVPRRRDGRLRHGPTAPVGASQAAVRVDAGDLTARAPERGVDEVAVVAHSFNRIVDDLGARPRARAFGPDPTSAARRRLARTHDTADRDPRLYRHVDDGRDSARRRTRDRYFRNIDEETRRLESIIKDLRDLARLEGGGAPLQSGARAGTGAVRTGRRTARTGAGCPPHQTRSTCRRQRRNSSRAIRIGWSRRCRISRPTRSGTRPDGGEIT